MPLVRPSLLNFAVALLMAVTCLCPSAAQAANGTWLGTEDAMWTNSNNWSASPYAGQQTGETATFDNAGNNNTNLNISGLYNIGTFIFTGASVAAYTIGSGRPTARRSSWAPTIVHTASTVHAPTARHLTVRFSSAEAITTAVASSGTTPQANC
jgi:hypothetical protein